VSKNKVVKVSENKVVKVSENKVVTCPKCKAGVKKLNGYLMT
jgi:hypothetical protein